MRLTCAGSAVRVRYRPPKKKDHQQVVFLFWYGIPDNGLERRQSGICNKKTAALKVAVYLLQLFKKAFNSLKGFIADGVLNFAGIGSGSFLADTQPD